MTSEDLATPTASSVAKQLQDGTLAGTWTLDPSKTTIRLKTKAMWGLVPVKGTFDATGGSAVVTPAGAVTATLDISSASINTKMKKRDQHLRSADFFASDAFPTITVTIDGVEPTGSTLSAAGRLTVKDVSSPLTFPVTITGIADGSAELDAQVEIDRSKLGLDFRAKGATTMTNTLAVHAVFRRS